VKRISPISILLLSLHFVFAQNGKTISSQNSYKAEIDKISRDKKTQMAFEIIQQLEPVTMNMAKISTESDILIAGTVGEEGLGDL